MSEMAAAPPSTPAKRFANMNRLALLFIALWFLSDAVFLLTLPFLGPVLLLPIVLGFFLARFAPLLLYAVLYGKWSSPPTPSQ